MFLYLISVVYRCIPFKYTNLVENSDGTHEKVVEVLMINSTSGPGLVFPKVNLFPFIVNSFTNTVCVNIIITSC